MQDFWNQVILSNPLKKYIGVAIAILLSLAIKRFVSRYIAGVLFRLVKGPSSPVYRTSFISLVAKPISTFLFLFISFASLEKLHFPEEINFDIYEVTAKTIVHSIATTIIIVIFIWLLLRMVDFTAILLKQKASAAGDPRDNQLIVFFRDFIKVLIGIIGVLMVLNIAFNYKVDNFLAGLGLAGAALALAAKESVENLIASFIIFFDKPFTAGDTIKVQNITGTIERIGLRSTRIRTDQKTYVTVPNKQMVDSIVDNLSLRTQRKAEIRLQLELSTSPEALDRFTQSVKGLLAQENIESPTVYLTDIAPNAFLVSADYFTTSLTLDEFNLLKQQVNLSILTLLKEQQIDIAGAHTDIRVKSMQGT